MGVNHKLRDLLQLKQILVVPGAHDVLTAKIVENVGFQAVYLPSCGVSYTSLGKPDLGLLTMQEICTVAARIVDVVKIPVIADAETGYGNILNVARTVREYQKVGVAAIQLEDRDQIFPKRSGHFRAYELIPKEDMVGKIKAALDARMDDNLMIIARTDARAAQGLDKALERAMAYSQAGADIILLHGLESIEEMEVTVKSIDSFLMTNVVEGGKTPNYSARELEQVGYDMVVFPSTAARTVANSVTRVMTEIFNKGTTRECMHELLLFSELNELLGLRRINEEIDRLALSKLNNTDSILGGK